MITHTEAIIFKSVDYQESSKIVTAFTLEHGKIALMVRGVKKPKSKFSGLIEIGNILDVVYYYKSSRSVQILSEASYSVKNKNLRSDFEKMATMTSSIELISQLLHDNEINEPLFIFTKKMLSWLDSADVHPPQIFPYIQIRLAELTGIGLQLDAQDEDNKTNYLNLESGLVTDKQVSSHSYKLTPKQFAYIRIALLAKSSKLFDIDFATGELRQLIEHLDRYLKYHVEGLKARKSDAIFEQILQE
ncbi:DNA repair protein RecO [Aliifodinibius salipaludis]|uniref:DNA repair protein RecO n=1 Tax=Fodinibius salipaludis TaxID=2032627 RepID=A0A2A2G9B3_9BACT|nr:DNA repair protein RecO [Aliifodinibius salipaludis]PAU93898.1 DNA repair protein RecO [Aliifodinibius salipaludis]